MAHKKGVGSTKNNRDSNAQRRGAKAGDGQFVTGGSIIYRQLGNRWFPGKNAGQGRDFTIFAKVDGYVKFETKKSGKRYIHIMTEQSAEPALATAGAPAPDEPVASPDAPTEKVKIEKPEA